MEGSKNVQERPLLLTFLPGGMTMSYYCGVVAALYDLFEISNIMTFGASIGCCPAFALLTGMSVENMMRQTVELLLVLKTRRFGPFFMPRNIAEEVLRKCTNPWAKRTGEIWFGLTKIPSFTFEAINLNKAIGIGVSPIDLFAASICVPPFFTRPHVVGKLGSYVDGGVGQFTNFLWDMVKSFLFCSKKRVKTVSAGLGRASETGCRGEVVISPCYFLPGDITPSKSQRLKLQDHLFSMSWEQNSSQFQLGYDNIVSAKDFLVQNGLHLKEDCADNKMQYLADYDRIWKSSMDLVAPELTFRILSILMFFVSWLDYFLAMIYSLFYYLTSRTS